MTGWRLALLRIWAGLGFTLSVIAVGLGITHHDYLTVVLSTLYATLWAFVYVRLVK